MLSSLMPLPSNLLFLILDRYSVTLSGNMAENPKSFARRDRLLEIESKVQSWWVEKDVFKSESQEQPPGPGEKFFGNFPFPYMNGFLHLGHAFSLSKVEFAAAYHRLRGANVLFPFGFHCTGMPIKAAADKLAREIQQFGNPPEFPSAVDEEASQPLEQEDANAGSQSCLLYTSPSPRDGLLSRMPSSA